MAEEYLYPGHELQLFEKAVNWKTYLAKKLLPYLKEDVLECGAGIGSNVAYLNNGTAKTWCLLEPDKNMVDLLTKRLAEGTLPPNTKIQQGTTKDLEPGSQFDTIIYIDVLEHVKDDSLELATAIQHLKPSGYLVVLSPAFQFLFSPFDKAIGHYRRYSARQLKNIAPPPLHIQKTVYLDTMGFFASAANKLLLNQSTPNEKQIHFWDKWLIPVSKITDWLFFFSFGKSILAIWKKK